MIFYDVLCCSMIKHWRYNCNSSNTAVKVLEGAGGGQLAVEREMQGGGAQGLQVTVLF